jgi:arginase family enzyme
MVHPRNEENSPGSRRCELHCSFRNGCPHFVQLKIVGADLVEVAPPYESQDEITSVAAANLLWEILSLMVKTPA